MNIFSSIQLVTIMTVLCQLKGENNDFDLWVAGIRVFFFPSIFFKTKPFKHLVLALVK